MKIRAQGALEYLLMIGASILVVAVVIVAISGVLTETNDQNAGTNYGNQMDGLKGLINLSRDPSENPQDIFKSDKEIKIQGILFKGSQN